MEQSTYNIFQHYWFFVDALLGGLLVFLLFVQGGQTFILSLAKNNQEKALIANSLGRKWEFTFTTLVTFGGAFFASFPLFYSTSFGGAYWVWILILFAFIIQAISYEFRSKPNNFLGQKTFDVFLFLNGALGTILLGTAVATLFTGSAFSITETKSVIWEGPLRGVEAAFNIHNLSLGLAVFFLARVNGLLYFINSISDETFIARAQKRILPNTIGFLVTFLTFVIWLFLRDGYAVNPDTGEVFMQSFKYFNNMIQMPLVGIFFLIGVVLVLFGLFRALFTDKKNGAIWFTGIGTVLAVVTLLLDAGFNNTAFYPSFSSLQSSLTIHNASSSPFTLKAMSIVSILVPFVLAYIWYAWRAINKEKITTTELESHDGGHVY
ncbi:cytochrome d ubiquinol oxidase subunit II [Saccharicrinis sp. FJH2]|uniref:cytochrome d ubiquinol oxidase subunit II n=1 Tax=unclassified Saccharicrinis TaxID=2646859 RepID=UPI0035D418FA